jgi:hypothetical protein
MSRKTITLIAAGVIIAAVAVFITWKWVFREAETDVSSQKADITMDAAALVQSFETNEDSANAKYLNKIIGISGNVDTIKVNDDNITVYLKNPEDMSGVMCSFDKSAIDPTSIKQGDKVKIKGICSGYLLDVVLNKCAIDK